MAELVTYEVELEGIRPVVFDRYPGNNETKLEPEEKFYFGEDGRTLTLPALNLHSMITAENSPSAAKLYYKSTDFKKLAFVLRGVFHIEPDRIPFMRNGEPVRFEGFGKNGIEILKAVPRVKKGVPQPTLRPMLNLPWTLAFKLHFLPTEYCGEKQWRELWQIGTEIVGIMAYRGMYGKSEIRKWRTVKAEKGK